MKNLLNIDETYKRRRRRRKRRRIRRRSANLRFRWWPSKTRIVLHVQSVRRDIIMYSSVTVQARFYIFNLSLGKIKASYVREGRKQNDCPSRNLNMVPQFMCWVNHKNTNIFPKLFTFWLYYFSKYSHFQ